MVFLYPFRLLARGRVLVRGVGPEMPDEFQVRDIY
jgi:hypothetical protein